MKLQGSNILGQEQIDLLTTRGLNFLSFQSNLKRFIVFNIKRWAYEFRLEHLLFLYYIYF